MGREEIADLYDLAVGSAGLREVAVPFERSRHGERGTGEFTLAQAFVRDDEESLVAADGAVENAAELVAVVAGQSLSARVGEKVVGIEHRIADAARTALWPRARRLQLPIRLQFHND